MRDREERTLPEVHEQEPNPFTDRQNLEPEPSFGELEDEAEDVDEDFVSGESTSDIEEYSMQDSDDDPSEEEQPRNHDDDDPWGDGIHDTPLTKRYEDVADRDELARRLEDIVADAYEWYQRSEEDDAQEIYETLVAVAERLGNPSEDTTRTEAFGMPVEDDSADDSV